MSNFVKVGQSILDISRFFNFSRWHLPPSWVLKILNFIGWQVSKNDDSSPSQILSKLVKRFLRHRDSLEFQDGSHAPCWILKISKCYWLMESRGVRLHHHHISIKCQNRSVCCGDNAFFIFQDGGRLPFWWAVDKVTVSHWQSQLPLTLCCLYRAASDKL